MRSKRRDGFVYDPVLTPERKEQSRRRARQTMIVRRARERVYAKWKREAEQRLGASGQGGELKCQSVSEPGSIPEVERTGTS